MDATARGIAMAGDDPRIPAGGACTKLLINVRLCDGPGEEVHSSFPCRTAFYGLREARRSECGAAIAEPHRARGSPGDRGRRLRLVERLCRDVAAAGAAQRAVARKARRTAGEDRRSLHGTRWHAAGCQSPDRIAA